MRILLGSVSLLALMTTPALAQEEPEFDRIIVTSSPLQVLADEIVGSADVVTADHLEENLSGSLADTIAHEPGVTTTFFGPAASRPVIRGLGSDRVRVLVNGVGLADASAASPDHAVSSEALEAERVEILRGPAAIAYGGGAVGGVVNVIDGRVPDRAPDNGLEGRFYAGATSVDDGYQFAGRARFATGPIVFHLEAMQRASENYEIPGYAESARQRALEEEDHHDDDALIAFAEEEEEHVYGVVPSSDLEFASGSIGASYIGDWGFFGIAYKTMDGEYGLPGHAHGHDEDHAEDFPVLACAEAEGEEGSCLILTQNRWDSRGDIELPGAPIERVRFSFGTGDYRHREIEDGAVGTVFENEGWEGRLELRHRPIGSVEGAFGIQSFSKDFAAIGAEAYIVPVQTQDTGLFVVERFDAGDWGLEGGARVEMRDVEIATASRSFETFSASGSVFFRPEQDVFLAATAAISERAPTDVELFAEGAHLATQSYEIGNANLSPERAASIDLTARLQGPEWSLEGAVFFADYDGFIGLFPTGAEQDELPVFAYDQRDATIWGFEGRAERDLGSAGQWDFRGEVTAEYVRGELDSGGNLPRIPPLGLSAMVEAETDWVTAHVEAVWASEQDRIASFELPTDSYTMINAQAVFRPVADRDVRLILEARNLTDEEARLHTSFLKDLLPLPGRNFRAALSVAF
ncbi:TonB-dependent receptor [Hyphobacterium sp. HN65]|uniref:TonB-dependent receptor n=1 Tax=Hyphobacterium lacteum TaxID=3116575 RepID=A0ABU7LN83_9PROT|nr:TonB-dependent receptor [Hyphobacterium sp. HN65]MEE2525386.1 TonB-dependent receptor [Hyphobacterium sp. HN65]